MNMYERDISDAIIRWIDIQTRLEKLNVTKICEPDNIHSFVLPKNASETCKPLKIIFRKSLSSGECPTDWRSANVAPIHKKEDRTYLNNYRPKSGTSQDCKVMESIVRANSLNHLGENIIL